MPKLGDRLVYYPIEGAEDYMTKVKELEIDFSKCYYRNGIPQPNRYTIQKRYDLPLINYLPFSVQPGWSPPFTLAVKACQTQVMPSFINHSLKSTTQRGGTLSAKAFHLLSPYSVIVSAAGNHFKPEDSKLIPKYKEQLSQSDEMIVVGSLAPNGERSSFSNEGAEVHILAPADKYITSLDCEGNHHRVFSGTSGAAPLVTGSLGAFEELSGYHPTTKEAKTLLKHTAIPVPSSVEGGPGYGKNGHGMVNAYKLAMVGERLKKQCGQDINCFKQRINNLESYNFDPPADLLNRISMAFPECDKKCINMQSNCKGANCVNSKEDQCQNRKNLFNELRKAAFLSPKNGELWRTIACIYQSDGFTEDAKGILATYKAINYNYKDRDKYNKKYNHLYCKNDLDCNLVPITNECNVAEDDLVELIENSEQNFFVDKEKDFIPMNKHASEIYYLSCMQNGESPPKCNGKCRCSDTEIAINEPTKDEISSPSIVSKTQYNTRCEKNQCVMDTEEILFGKSANDGSLILEDQSITSPSSSGAIQ